MTIPKQSEKLLDWSYPSYIKTMRMISGKGTDVHLNYREFNHICMKHVYDHFSNRQSIRKVGAMINERGGLEQMQINFHVFEMMVIRNLKKLKHEDQPQIMSKVRKVLNETWIGIGDWTHNSAPKPVCLLQKGS